MSLKDVEKKLYGFSKGEEKKEEKKTAESPFVEEEKKELENDWEDLDKSVNFDSGQNKISKKIGVFTKTTFWIAVALFLVLAGFVYYFISQFNKTKDFRFEIKGPSKVMIARPFEISIELENKSKSTLKQPEILITLPEGVISLDSNNDKQIIKESLGSMESSALIQKRYNLAIVKDEGSIKKIDVSFSYFPPDIKTRFEKKKAIEIEAGQPAISVSMSTPQKIFNSEDLEIGLDYKNLSDYDFKNVKLKMVYPNNFIFKNTTASTTSGNNVWVFDDLPASSQGNFTIKGLLQGPDQSFSEIKSQLFVTFNNKEYLLGEKTANLVIASSPLSLFINLKDNPNYVASPGEDLTYRLFYKNNTDVGLTDAVVKAKVSGVMYDFATTRTNGNFDSVNTVVTWNASNVSILKFLEPGKEGYVEFNIKIKENYPIKRMFDNNFVLKVQAEITSPTVPYNVSSDKSIGLASLETKIKGNIEITSSYEYPKGPYPPKVDQPTTYEIKLAIKNYSTNVRNVEVKSYLQSGAKWLNIVRSDAGSIPSYNERTGEITWTIDRILATKGVINKPLEAVFDIEITPNIIQKGQLLPILGDTEISAEDEFTGVRLTNKIKNLTTDQIVSQ